jgi:hypothetical protein
MGRPKGSKNKRKKPAPKPGRKPPRNKAAYTRLAKKSKVENAPDSTRKSKFVQQAKPLAECTQREIELAGHAAVQHAIRMGRPHLAQDFKSFLYEDLVQQGTLYYNLRWRWASFLKRELGNLSNKKGSARAKANSIGRVDIDATVTTEDGSELQLQLEDPSPRADEPNLTKQIWEGFEGRDRAIIVLYVKWGLTIYEIAECFGCSPQNIQVLLSKIKDKLPRKAASARREEASI